ncbi:uncharacterized protein METZ01_LOCUS179149, partial [marine metagenome]
VSNLGVLEARGGDAAGQDERETGQRYRQSVGGGGGGGRVAIISDGTVVKGSVNVNGGKGMAEGLPGLPGSVYVGPKSQVAGNLTFNSGTLTFDTGGSWSHSSGAKGAGMVTHHSFEGNGGARYGYGICTFSFDSVNLGSSVAVLVRGRNALQLNVTGNVLIDTAISLNGSSGSQGAYSGRSGPGGWDSGRAADNVTSNEHPALEGQGPGGGRGFETGRSNGGGSYGGKGTGGLLGGTPGSTYGDEVITYLVGGSGAGHAEGGTGNSGGGGGAIGIRSDANITIQANGSISANGGHGLYVGDRSGAGGSGGAVRIEAANITNLGKISAKGGDALGGSSSGGAGGGGRVALLAPGAVVQGSIDQAGGETIRSTDLERPLDLLLWYKFDESIGTTATDSSGNGHDGSLVSGPTWTQGKIGGALSFDGTDDHVALGNPPALNVTGNETISMWLKPMSLNDRRNPYAKAYGGTGSFTLETNGTLRYFYGTSGQNAQPYASYTTGTPLGTNVWTNVVLVRDLDAMKVQYYVNGSLANTQNATYASATAGNLEAFIGKGYTSPFHGVIDEMTFTGSVRNDEWVKATYENQKADSTYLSFSNFQGPPAFIGSTDVYGKVGESMSPFNISVIGGGVLSYSAVGVPPGVYLNAA